MKKLSKDEMKNISGGGISISAVALIAGGITMLIGALDGFFRPLGCRE